MQAGTYVVVARALAVGIDEIENDESSTTAKAMTSHDMEL